MFARKLMGLLAGILVLASGESFAAGPPETTQALGVIVARGDVRIDERPALPGTVLFAGSVVATGKSSTAVMKLRSGFAATLAENGEAVLSADTPSVFRLKKGAAVIRNDAAEPRRVEVNGAAVVLEGRPGEPAISAIAFVGGAGVVTAERGRVEIRRRGSTLLVPPGKSVRLEAGSPQAAGQQAGKVSHAIPDEVVQRLGKGAEIELKISDPVNWEDLVRTMRAGRLRIAMLDGSVLNIGARSVMRIVKHDPQSQQTQIEIQLGRLGGEVTKVTQPGGSFQVRTQTAVMGVVGSIFLMNALRDMTEITCIEGKLNIRNVNPAVGGEVTLNPGQRTSVPRGQPPGGVASANTSQIVNEVGQTAAGESLSPGLTQSLQTLGATDTQLASLAAQVPGTAGAQAGAAGAQAGQAGAQGAMTAARVAGVGASAGAAAASGAAIGRAGDARDNLDSAESSLEDATAASDAANAAAAAAVATSGEVLEGIDAIIDVISPITPGCGCR